MEIENTMIKFHQAKKWETAKFVAGEIACFLSLVGCIWIMILLAVAFTPT